MYSVGWNETKLSMLNRNRILRIGSRVPEMRPLSTDKDKDVQPYVVYRLYRSGSLYGNLHTGLHTASQKKCKQKNKHVRVYSERAVTVPEHGCRVWSWALSMCDVLINPYIEATPLRSFTV